MCKFENVQMCKWDIFFEKLTAVRWIVAAVQIRRQGRCKIDYYCSL